MRTRNFEKKIYNINKVKWHTENYGQLDHAAGREGVGLCCYATYNAAPPDHHNNKFYMNTAKRKEKAARLRYVKENYRKGEGCEVRIYMACFKCAMPILLLGTTENIIDYKQRGESEKYD